MLLDSKSQHPIFQTQRQTNMLQENILNVRPKRSNDKDILFVQEQCVRVMINGRPTTIDFSKSDVITLGREDILQSDLYHLNLDKFKAPRYGVSRSHCQLTMKWGQLFVSDLESTNGTYLNGTCLTPYQPYVIKVNSLLGLGKLSINFFGSK